MHNIDLIVGARPNFMKAAPVLRASENSDIQIRLVHTGQHYDEEMNDTFFRDLGIRAPDVALKVGSSSHASQVAAIMVAYEATLLENGLPDATMVVGDVNSTIAAALVASKLGVPVVHLEAGLRSGDWSMPEEINRLATDAISRLLLTPSRDADQLLRQEGVSDDRIRFVGNLMADTLHHQLGAARQLDTSTRMGLRHDGAVTPYVLATLHRPSNVDERESLTALIDMLAGLGRDAPVLFPIHPRTAARLREWDLENRFAALTAVDEPIGSHGLYGLPPLSYNVFLHLMDRCAVVLTDSGGIQEETTVLGKPCLTLRENTERPVTVQEGTNTIVGRDFQLAERLARDAISGHGKQGRVPEGWEGQAAQRVVAALQAFLPGLAGR